MGFAGGSGETTQFYQDLDIEFGFTGQSENGLSFGAFVDLSDGGVQQYIGDGIAEEVINLLAGMDGLVVAARTSSFAFRFSLSENQSSQFPECE